MAWVSDAVLAAANSMRSFIGVEREDTPARGVERADVRPDEAAEPARLMDQFRKVVLDNSLVEGMSRMASAAKVKIGQVADEGIGGSRRVGAAANRAGVRGAVQQDVLAEGEEKMGDPVGAPGGPGGPLLLQEVDDGESAEGVEGESTNGAEGEQEFLPFRLYRMASTKVNTAIETQKRNTMRAHLKKLDREGSIASIRPLTDQEMDDVESMMLHVEKAIRILQFSEQDIKKNCFNCQVQCLVGIGRVNYDEQREGQEGLLHLTVSEVMDKVLAGFFVELIWSNRHRVINYLFTSLEKEIAKLVLVMDRVQILQKSGNHVLETLKNFSTIYEHNTRPWKKVIDKLIEEDRLEEAFVVAGGQRVAAADVQPIQIAITSARNKRRLIVKN